MTKADTSKIVPTKLPSAFLSLISVFSLFAVWGTFLSIQYFDLNPIPSMFFVGRDGWCDLSHSEGLGIHCFGDFGFMIQTLTSSNPWSGMNNYTAAGTAIFLPFRLLFDLTGSYNLSVGFYLVASAVALVWPVWKFAKDWRLSTKIALIAASFTSFPFLVALDRGNSIVFAVPAIYGWLVAIKQGDLIRARWWLILASLVKPQFLILILISFKRGQIKWLVTTAAMAGIAHLGFFALWWKSFPENILDAARNIAGYQQYVNLSYPWPSNVSLARPTFWLELIVRFAFGFDTQPSEMSRFFSVEFGSVISILIALALIALTLTLQSTEKGITRAVNLLIIASLFSSVSFAYYLVFTIPLALVLLESDDSILRSPRSWADKFLALSLSLSLVRFPLPLPYSSPTTDYLLTSGELVPIAFLGYLISTLFANSPIGERVCVHEASTLNRKNETKKTERGIGK